MPSNGSSLWRCWPPWLALTFAVNDRASRVDMPAPDNTFGIYHVTN